MNPKEIFWIVKNGIKMTGMPAWGKTQSNYKIWAITAAVKKMNDIPVKVYNSIPVKEDEDNNAETEEGPDTTSHELRYH